MKYEMNKIYLIEKLSIDILENRSSDAIQWTPVGFVETKEEAIEIQKSRPITEYHMKKYPWPLEYVEEKYWYRYKMINRYEKGIEIND